MDVGDLIKFRFQFPVGDFTAPWRYGIVISACDKINETVKVLTSGQIIEIHKAVIEIQQKISY